MHDHQARSRRCAIWTLLIMIVFLALHLRSPTTQPMNLISKSSSESSNSTANHHDVKVITITSNHQPNNGTLSFEAAFPSNHSNVDAVFDALLPGKGCIGNRSNSAWMEAAFQSARFVKNEDTLFLENNNSGQQEHHFYPLPLFNHGNVRGGVALFQNAYIHGEEPPMVFDCEHVYVPGSCGQGNARKESLIMKQLLDEASTVITMDAAVMIYQVWGEAFFHAMVEDLPRLAYVLEYLRANPETVILAPQALVRVSHDLNHVLGLNATQSWITYRPTQKRTLYFAKRLLVPTGTPCGGAQPKCVEQIQQAVMSTIATSVTSTDPIFQQKDSSNNNNKFLLVLQKRKSRKLLNHAKLLEAMRKKFAACCIVKEFLGDESLMETIALHHSAHVVVGPHGAGFANLIWSQPGRGMVELHPQYGNANSNGGINGCHLQTARAAGLHATQVIQMDGSKFRDFSADIASALDAIQDVLERVIHNTLSYNNGTV